jgi:hypothetical protein
MAKYRRQHWVPRSYLLRWSPDERCVHTYDRVTGAAKLISVQDVAQRTYFYERFLRGGKGRTADTAAFGVLEREYQRWEDALMAATEVAERVASGGPGSLEERRTMALAVAVQMVRTPAFRAGIVDAVSEELTGQFIEYLRETNPRLAASLDSKYRLEFAGEDMPSLIHAITVWQSDLVTRIAATLYHYIWVIGSNASGIPLYTSDDPVAMVLHDATPTERQGASGDVLPSSIAALTDAITPRAIELVFPLSPNLALLMYQPDMFADLRERQGQVRVMGAGTVARLNQALAARCDRQVYSADGDFAIARQILEPRGQ